MNLPLEARRCLLYSEPAEHEIASYTLPVLESAARGRDTRLIAPNRVLMICKYSYIGTQSVRSINIIVNIRANGGGRGSARRRRGARIDSRPRDTLYLSSHRCPLAGLTKKEIGFADFDPFVFGQRPAMRAGAEKCEGALIGRPGPAPAQPGAAREPPPLSSRAVAATHADLFGFPLFINLIKLNLTLRCRCCDASAY